MGLLCSWMSFPLTMNKTIYYMKSAYRPLTMHYMLRGLSMMGKGTAVEKLNHYEVLGVQRDASLDDIRCAFLKLSKECHPDMNLHNPKTHEKFVQVNEAYSVLSKELSRRDYDLSLITKESSRYPYHSPSGAESKRPYYHEAQNQFHDPFIYSMRDKSKDRFYANQPYYGVRGLTKVSNSQIVLSCFGIILIGIILHYIAVKRSSSLHIETLNERDAKTHKLWRDANNPTFFTQRLKSLRSKIDEDASKKNE